MKKLLITMTILFFASCSLEKFERPVADEEQSVSDEKISENDIADGDEINDDFVEIKDDLNDELNDISEIPDYDFIYLEGVLCTGQQKCYNNDEEIVCPGIESIYHGNDYQNILESKCLKPDLTVKDTGSGKIVIDRITALIWQRTLSDEKYTWSAAINYCESLQYGGYDDWRLPDLREMRTIVSFGNENPPAIHPSYFLNTPPEVFWTSSENITDKTLGAFVDFMYGGSGLRYKDGEYSARCVRGNELPLKDVDEKTVKENAIVIDPLSHLVWNRQFVAGKTWEKALEYCKKLNYGGRSDWRLPNINELQTLISMVDSLPASALKDIPSEKFWSSTTDSLYYAFYALTVDFRNGEITGEKKTGENSFLCVTGDIAKEKDMCSDDKGCPEGEFCVDLYCYKDEDACSSDNKCADGSSCYNGLCFSSDLFVSRWQTGLSGISQKNEIRLPLVENGTYDFTVFWGDKTSSVVKFWSDPAVLHRYEVPGTYTVAIEGKLEGWSFCKFDPYEQKCKNANDSNKLMEIDQWGGFMMGETESQFAGCSYLDVKASDVPDLSKTSSLKAAFWNCYNLKGGHSFNNWNVSNVTNMRYLFNKAESFNQDISGWDVSKVTDMGWLFNGAADFNEDISVWDVSKVTNFSWAFNGAVSFNQDISRWNVSSATHMYKTFSHAFSFNQDISDWDVSNVINMSYMFENAVSFDQDISDWNVSAVTEMSNMFYEAASFNRDLEKWDVSNVTMMDYMFYGADVFNGDVTEWNVSKVLDMDSMFEGAVSFDQDLSKWNVANVTSFNNFIKNGTLSTENYDALLNGWSKLSLKSGRSFNGGKSKYSSSGETGRSVLVNDFKWIITDGGKE